MLNDTRKVGGALSGSNIANRFRTRASHKHHERVVIAGKGIEALKLHVSQAARERNARRRLEKNGLRDSTMRILLNPPNFDR